MRREEAEVLQAEVVEEGAIALQTLERCEEAIAQGLESFYRVGLALTTVRDGKLYKLQGFKSFEQYCSERWGIKKTHAYRLIESAEVVENLSPIGDVLPENEYQIRPLKKLPPEQQREVWGSILSSAIDGKVTGKTVEQAVRRQLNNPEPSQEHYTPADIWQRVLKVWPEGIDLDPCCNPGDPVVPARLHYRRKDNGLSLPWRGRVFLNPPYSDKEFSLLDWVDFAKTQSTLIEAIWFVPAYTDTNWWDRLHEPPTKVCDVPLVCEIKGRIKYQGNSDYARFPSAVVYWGERREAFGEAFSKIGRIKQEVLL